MPIRFWLPLKTLMQAPASACLHRTLHLHWLRWNGNTSSGYWRTAMAMFRRQRGCWAFIAGRCKESYRRTRRRRCEGIATKRHKTHRKEKGKTAGCNLFLSDHPVHAYFLADLADHQWLIQKPNTNARSSRRHKFQDSLVCSRCSLLRIFAAIIFFILFCAFSWPPSAVYMYRLLRIMNPCR